MLNHFYFKVLPDNTVLITNDFGHYAFLTHSDFIKLMSKTSALKSELEEVLRDKRFIVSQQDIYSNEVMYQLRNMKCHVFNATSLHIFVVTNACNLRCVYCQAKAQGKCELKRMNAATAHRAVDIALQSPAQHLTFEFQGGEPLLNFPIIKEIIEYAKIVSTNKSISYSLVSNLSLINDEIIDFLVCNGVSISTSLDGPQYIHDVNRVDSSGGGSYAMVKRAIESLHARGCSVGAIQTTTRQSLPYAREIVREYVQTGSAGIFIRPLTPLGFAKEAWETIGYTPQEFLNFYREAFNEVLEINRTIRVFPEQHASILLQKILCQHGTNYMDLCSPCGAGFGQLAYYYDDNVYTCDEGRMVAESGDQAFLLGNVFTHSYRDIVSCDTCKATAIASVTEAIAGCCDCVYQPYCGVCPVVLYATSGDIFSHDAKSWRCQIFKGILDILFEYIQRAEPSTMQILQSWVEV